MEQGSLELFKDILGYENQYEVSNLGRVRNKLTKHFISVRIGKIGYRLANLWKNNRYKTFYVHRLIAIHFIPNPDNLPEVNHLDGNKTNNDLNNLEWTSIAENVRHSIKTGLTPLGEKRRNAKLTNDQAMQIYRLIKTGLYERQEIADQFSVSVTQVSQIKNKREWKHIHK